MHFRLRLAAVLVHERLVTAFLVTFPYQRPARDLRFSAGNGDGPREWVLVMGMRHWAGNAIDRRPCHELRGAARTFALMCYLLLFALRGERSNIDGEEGKERTSLHETL